MTYLSAVYSVISLLVISNNQLSDTTNHRISNCISNNGCPSVSFFECVACYKSTCASLSDKELKWIR